VRAAVAPTLHCPRCATAHPPGAELGHLTTVTCAACGLVFDTEEGARAAPNDAMPRRRAPAPEGFTAKRDGERLELRIPEYRDGTLLLGLAVAVCVFPIVMFANAGLRTPTILFGAIFGPLALYTAYMMLGLALNQVIIRVDSTTLVATEAPIKLRRAVRMPTAEVHLLGVAVKPTRHGTRFEVIAGSVVDGKVAQRALAVRRSHDAAQEIVDVLTEHLRLLGHPMKSITE
jgi:hypothetical protein